MYWKKRGITDKKTIAAIINGICIVLFMFMWIFMYAIPDEIQDQLMPVFIIINPFKIGPWIMGIGFLCTCLWCRGRTGLIWGAVMLICYLLTATVSLVGLMGYPSGFDLLWYLHPLIIVIACIIAIQRRKRDHNDS